MDLELVVTRYHQLHMFLGSERVSQAVHDLFNVLKIVYFNFMHVAVLSTFMSTCMTCAQGSHQRVSDPL